MLPITYPLPIGLAALAGTLAIVVWFLNLHKNDKQPVGFARFLATLLPQTSLLLFVVGICSVYHFFNPTVLARVSPSPTPTPEREVCDHMLRLLKKQFGLYSAGCLMSAGEDFNWTRYSQQAPATDREDLLEDIQIFGGSYRNRFLDLMNKSIDFSAMISAEHPPSHRLALKEFSDEMRTLTLWIDQNMVQVDQDDDLGLLREAFESRLEDANDAVYEIEIVEKQVENS